MDLIKTFELTKNFSLADKKMIYAVNDINLTIKKGQSFGFARALYYRLHLW